MFVMDLHRGTRMSEAIYLVSLKLRKEAMVPLGAELHNIRSQRDM